MQPYKLELYMIGNLQRWETLGEERKLTFEPNEQNRRMISVI